MKLIAPGQRKGNKFYLMRARVAGREVEISTKTTDYDEAYQLANRFIQEGAAAWPPNTGSLTASICRSLTKTLDEVRRSGRNSQCGIYFLLRGGIIQYIGQSARVRARIKSHREEKRFLFDSWVVVACGHAELDLLEAAYIYRYRPSFNRGVSRGVVSVIRGDSSGE